MKKETIVENFYNHVSATEQPKSADVRSIQKKFSHPVVDSKKSCTFAPAKRAQVVELVDTLL
ncbi:MAG: hypothetical protein J6X16_05760 [Bacteroidales bacterium]|nr:hypothetical protein [Bacteroidales bacterium]